MMLINTGFLIRLIINEFEKKEGITVSVFGYLIVISI